MKGEQLQNFVEHSFLQDPPTGSDGQRYSLKTGDSRPRPAVSIGSWMLLDALAYHSMAYRAHRLRWDAPYVRPALRRRLNPNFVDALMNWPRSWTSVQTACGPEEMASWLSAERSHLLSLCGGPDGD